ncbi:hypothetical protein KY359_02750, partial [Candidatus Woesearchaeota archaeon]|nr:hypothetical protein [Candidatus Woesearchaeota archaeon]
MTAEDSAAQGVERLDISSSLVNAYVINVGKALLLIGALIGAFYLVIFIVGENPFAGILETIGIP